MERVNWSLIIFDYFSPTDFFIQCLFSSSNSGVILFFHGHVGNFL